MTSERHIADTHVDNEGMSICGKKLELDWHFLDVDHAFIAMRGGHSTEVCKACVQSVLEVFNDQ